MKKLLTSLAICLSVVFFMARCTDQDEPQSIEAIQAELGAFIQLEINESTSPSMTNIENFLESKGLIKITLENNAQAYKEIMEEVESLNNNLNSGRLAGCDVEYSGMMDAGSGCWVGVYIYGDGCYHAGCISNSWHCDEGAGQSGEVYYC